MKRYHKRREDIFCMAKIMEQLADESITGPIDKFLYFSPINSGHGPRIKFYGGTSQTQDTQKSPSFGFSKDGGTDVQLEPWMNKKNCPNAFDSEYLKYVKNFIDSHIAILELVWHKHLDEGIALGYFHGQLSFQELVEEIDYCSEYPDLQNVKSERELHEFCLSNDLYRF